jgi:DNA transformation protein
MSASPEFREFLQEHLAALGPIQFKRMFGGAGVYLHDRIFGLIFQDVLYLKTSDATRPLFEAAGSQPFTYEAKGKRVSLAYWSLPDTAMDDADEAVDWVRRVVV